MKLRDLGEFPFLRRLRDRMPADPRVLLGLGDDCAALSLPGTTLLTTDAMIEDVHFRREWTTFFVLGEKAFAVNASDIAAMGGEPTFALLSLGVPQECEVEDLDAFFDGFVRAAGACGAALIGGNMSAAPCLMLSVTLLGRAPHGVVTRAGARVGDDLYVTGTLGDAALGLCLLQEGRNGAEAQAVKARFLCPSVRLAIGQEVAARRLATAMIDVSDGLLQDLGHLCEESQVGALVEAPTLPLSAGYRALLGDRDWSLALTGGEDYELLFSAAAEHRAAVGVLAQSSGCAITRIGCIVPQAEGLSVCGPDGTTYTPAHAGYDHFRQA
ncbi:MAG: thiamine-phosphate kinase [Deltaproteobacteria bacterium]|nr:thiamine-phosphate kinase [Deltaproteobacteria bacterium]